MLILPCKIPVIYLLRFKVVDNKWKKKNRKEKNNKMCEEKNKIIFMSIQNLYEVEHTELNSYSICLKELNMCISKNITD